MTSELSRRRAIGLLAAGGAGLALGCDGESPRGRLARPSNRERPPADPTGRDAVLRVEPLTTPWQTQDPFLFCMHHDDDYPRGDARMGPAESLAGHRMGRDFDERLDWRMYHGEVVPGFPRHPHRGFETVTVVRRGLLDHSDSMGATARYGRGDVQWLTAGGGIQHAEMFPLLRADRDNPLELFQIWLNLPAVNKMVEPHFSMLWQPTIPARVTRDGAGRETRVTLVAGRMEGLAAPAPPPHSWASAAENHVGIFTIAMEPGARTVLPAAPDGVRRALYFFVGDGLRVGGRDVPARHHVAVRGASDLALEAGDTPAELVVLQGRPIGEPVARHGPFVMNTELEIRQAYADYQRTQFGGWPWPSPEPVHPRTHERFAMRPGGRVETPT
ncbi:MAG: pirin family protein [Sandaracinaceae bacterium]|nr:MAG: pirin family protein [Sandaracinaceae bacterium]